MKLPPLAAIFTFLSLTTGCAFEASPVEPLPEPPSPAPEPTHVVAHTLTIRDLAHLETIGDIIDRSPEVKRTVTFVGTSTWDSATWERVEAWVAARPPMTVVYAA